MQQRCHPLGKKRKKADQEMDILSPYQSACAKDLQETNLEEGFSGGDWDPHTGKKALQTDGEASDDCLDEFWDPEDDLEVKDKAGNHACMVEMLSDLEKNDPHNHEWKPKHKRKRAFQRMVSLRKYTEYCYTHLVMDCCYITVGTFTQCGLSRLLGH